MKKKPQKRSKIVIQKLTLQDLDKVSGSLAQKSGGTEGCTGSNDCACVCGGIKV